MYVFYFGIVSCLMKPFCVHSSMAIISLRENELIPVLNIFLLEFVRTCVYGFVCPYASGSSYCCHASVYAMIASPYASSHARIQKVLSEGV